MNKIESIVLNEGSFGKLITRAVLPFESLDILFGIVFDDAFFVFGCFSCTLNGRILSKRISRIMASKDDFVLDCCDSTNKTGSWRNHPLLGFCDRQIEISKETMEVIQKLKRLFGLHFSMAIAHNHPLIQSENLEEEDRSYLQTAYDLADEKIPFSDWLAKLQVNQTKELTKEDMKVIEALSEDSLGILVHGEKIERLLDGGLIEDFMSAFQIREGVAHKIDMRFIPFDFWKKVGIHQELSRIERSFSEIFK